MYFFFIAWASSGNPLLGRTGSRGRCWASIGLSQRPEPSGHAAHEEVDGLDIGGQHGRRFVLLCHTHRPQRGHTPFVQAGSETSDTGVEAVQPDLRCSWKSHSRSVVADVGDESTKPRSVVQPLRLRIPSRSTQSTARMLLLLSDKLDELLCSGYKWVSRFEAPCICTRWMGERWVEQMSRLHGTAC